MRHRLKFASLLLTINLMLAALKFVPAQTGYNVRILSAPAPPPGATLFTNDVNGINNHGQMIGLFDYLLGDGNNFAQPWLYSTRTLFNLNNLGIFGTDSSGHTNAIAVAINNSGQIAGYATAYDSNHNALGTDVFLYSNDVMTNLGRIGISAAVNDAGDIAGYTDRTPIVSSGFLYANGKTTILGGFGTNTNGKTSSQALGINNSQQVVGYAEVYDSNHEDLGTAAFRYANGSMTNLGTLGTDGMGMGHSQANAINNAGLAVGWSDVYDSSHNYEGHYPVTFANGQVTNLSTIIPNSNDNGGEAVSINNRGDIVGRSFSGLINANTATLWRNGVQINLNTLLPTGSAWLLEYTTGINNRGQICGNAIHNGVRDTYSPFLLTPFQNGDFNNDSSPDILWRNATTGDVVVSMMSGTTRTGNQVVSASVPLQWQVVATPDLNGDGYSDQIWQNTTTGEVAFWTLQNGVLLRSGTLASTVPLVWKIVGNADFNNDGNDDLVWQNQTTGAVYIWYLKKTQFLGSVAITAGVGASWKVVGTGDFNGDGYPDLLWRNTQTGDVYIWLLRGVILQNSLPVAASVPLNWSISGIGDYNNDGDPDLLWQDSKAGDVYVWLMHGTSYMGSTAISVGAGTTWQVVGPK